MTTGVSAITGELGKAVLDSTLIARITQWSINKTVGETAWGDSGTSGFTARAAGRKDVTGSLQGKLDSTSPVYNVFNEGDIVELVLWINATLYYVFPSALIKDFSFTHNVDTQEVTGWTANFGSDGIYYYPGEAGAPTHTLP